MGLDVDNIFRQLPSARRAVDFIRGGILSDPQRAYMWEVRISTKELNGGFLNDLRFYAKTAIIPAKSNEPIKIKYIGNTIMHHGMDNNDHLLNLNFWDDETLVVMSYFNNWLELTRTTQEGKSVSKPNLVADIKIKLKDSTDLVTTGEFIYKNAYPIGVGDINLTYESTDVVDIPVTFIYDYVQINK